VEYKTQHQKSKSTFFVRVACVNRDECGNVIGHFAGLDNEVSIPFKELSGMDNDLYRHQIGTAVCHNCQPSCLHADYCDAFKKCKFVDDMSRCQCATKGIMVGTCNCGQTHVDIYLQKDGKDFKKDKKGQYIRTCQKCNPTIAPCEGVVDKLKRRNEKSEKTQVA
jgi:hypothetical protein